MESRVALLSIIVENIECAGKINEILHEYGEYIIGRMGIPYKKRNINIISVALDAPQDIICAISGKVGKIEKVTVKTAFSNVFSEGDEK